MREAKMAEKNAGMDGSDEDEDESGEDSDASGQGSHRRAKSGSMGRSASRAGKSGMGSEDDLGESDEDPYEEEYDQGVGSLPNQPEMKRELI